MKCKGPFYSVHPPDSTLRRFDWALTQKHCNNLQCACKAESRLKLCQASILQFRPGLLEYIHTCSYSNCSERKTPVFLSDKKQVAGHAILAQG